MRIERLFLNRPIKMLQQFGLRVDQKPGMLVGNRLRIGQILFGEPHSKRRAPVGLTDMN